MRPSTIWYTLKQGFKNIKRNWMFSLACIITMAACIFLVGIFYSIVNNVDNIAHKVEAEVPITVFFDEGTTEEEIQAVGEEIQARSEVAKIEYESADQAWEEYKKQYFDDEDAADGFKDDNPLVNSSNYHVYLNDITKQTELVNYIQGLEHVRKVNQSEQASKTLGSINKLVSYVSIGVIGAAIPLIGLFFLYNSAVEFILTKFNVLTGIVDFIPIWQIYEGLIPMGLGLGVGIGLLGSFFTTRKHLRV